MVQSRIMLGCLGGGSPRSGGSGGYPSPSCQVEGNCGLGPNRWDRVANRGSETLPQHLLRQTKARGRFSLAEASHYFALEPSKAPFPQTLHFVGKEGIPRLVESSLLRENSTNFPKPKDVQGFSDANQEGTSGIQDCMPGSNHSYQETGRIKHIQAFWATRSGTFRQNLALSSIFRQDLALIFQAEPGPFRRDPPSLCLILYGTSTILIPKSIPHVNHM